MTCFVSELISAQTLLCALLLVPNIHNSLTRLHEQSLHFEKITFYMCMRALKYYIISK